MNEETRRVYDRYICEMVVWLRPYQTDEEFLLVDVENISSGGILVHTSHPFEMGALLDLQISVLQQTEMVTVEAKVVHCRTLEDEEYLMGLQFTRANGVNLPTFMAWLEAMFH